ncbi:MAG: MoaD/ThiS family protein [Armatimonadota bacterium]|nr:MoaD/ThiS family protein [Armatimonadota bacterium]MCX7777117.1 MoaD/ThiS family protein [Armatimonadota bacterium]MDW8025164.1 MoaD/ThiS family protein [Armatimonadota bacterium]
MRAIFRGKVYEFEEEKMKVRELLKRLNLSPESTLVVRDNEVLTEDELLKRGDEVRIISAISGGS